MRAHHRFRRRWLWVALLFSIVGLVIADARGWLLIRHRDDFGAYHGMRAPVLRIIDGDTFDIALPDALGARPATRIRLWGINAPEPARDNRPAQPLAAQAVQRLTQLTTRGPVTLWLEPQQPRDAFGSVLAFVEAADGARINELLLEEGLARVDERAPHSRLVRHRQLQGIATREKRGIWGVQEPSSPP